MRPLAVYDFDGLVEVHDRGQLDEVLARRFREGSNSFECSPIGAPWPALIVLVRGDLAMAHFLSGEGVGGEQARGAVSVPGDATVSFFENHEGAVIEIPIGSTISAQEAMSCVEEFAEDHRRPSVVDWIDL